jgi:diguanylate cyclase (GGDEF)-like protein
MDTMKEELHNILSNKQIKTVFQPIISLGDGSVLGHEALSRITCNGKINNPEMLFSIAGEYNRLWELELLCRTKAFEAAFYYMKPPYDKKLFINVNPNIMHDDTFKKGLTKGFLQQYKITPHNIIFEITERHIITDMQGFKSTIEHYRNQDYQIAIDDVGSGYSGLNLISDINPNYIKLDMKLISSINTDSLKYALVKGMVELSKNSNISLIAEGIETYAELETLVNLGVQYGQGYFIQKPDVEIQEIRQEVLETINTINFKKNDNSSNNFSSIYIESLYTFTDIISPTEVVSNVYDIFKYNPTCFGLCAIEDGVPVGIITREKLALNLSGYYGFAINQKKPISQLMDKYFLSVDYKTPVSIVSSIAMSRQNDKLYDFIVITKNSKYIGTVTIKDLLKRTTEIEVATAKHQNPLSGLPGNLMIEQKLNQCVSSTRNYSVAYFDIDNFKAYNDVYGFENGDLIIQLLTNILKDNVSAEQFIGHIGGDDFVIILDNYAADHYFINIVKQFELNVLEFYNNTDINHGYITTTNRHGEVEKFPLITLTYVVIDNHTRHYNNVFELTERLAGLKKLAKQKS